MIQFSDVTLMRGAKVLLQQANATLYPGHKAGLIGANGSGKSSLFALLQGKLHTDQGEVSLPKQWQLASVAQETPATDKPCLQYVLDGDQRYRQLQRQLQQAEQQHQGEQIALLHGQLEDIGGYDIEARAASILAGLGFSADQHQQPVSAFSGGWRMRLNLAQALLCHSDLLLLDEPTNHLDLDAVIWLEKWLQRYTGTLILISHDKDFLDNTIDQIISIENGTLVSYSGGYSSFEIQRAERLRLHQISIERQQQKAAHLQSFIDRFGAKASKAKQAQSRVKQLAKMQQLLPVQQDSPFSFEFAAPPRLPNPLIRMEDVQAGYDDKVILSHLQLNLVPGSRIGLLGKNGAGKSTLIKLLAGEKPPLAGQYHCSAGLRIGYFAQHQLELLHPDDSPLAHLQRLDGQATEQQLRTFLGSFAFIGDQALEPVGPMSGGEKARLVMALLVYQKPNLLLLDEPTNHLDLATRHGLNMALQGFTGAMLLISHDRFLLSSVCDEFYLVDNGTVQPFEGDLEDYRQYLFTQNTPPPTIGKSSASIDRKQQKRIEAAFRQKTQPLRKTLARQEKQMEVLHESVAKIDQQLTDTTLYHAENKAQLTTLLQQQAGLKSELETLELEWLDNQQQLENWQQEFERELAG